MNSARILTLRKTDQKYFGSFVTWCRSRIQKIGWADRVRIEEVVHIGKEERNIVHAIKHLKINWNGHIVRKNYLLQRGIEVKLEDRWNLTQEEEEEVSSY